MATHQARPRSFLRLRGKSFMSVVLTPDMPPEEWLAQLDDQIARSPQVFEGRPVLLDVSLLGSQDVIGPMIEALTARGIRVIGIDGSIPHALGPLGAHLPPVMAGGRNAALLGEAEPRATPPSVQAAPPPPADPTALIHDNPVRSGQSVTHTAGDVTIIGSVASGSEVIAGGSIHIYGTLRGRAVAGLLGSAITRPRIFVRRLEAELLAIDGVYKTADELNPALQGRAVQAWLQGEELMVAALD